MITLAYISKSDRRLSSVIGALMLCFTFIFLLIGITRMSFTHLIIGCLGFFLTVVFGWLSLDYSEKPIDDDNENQVDKAFKESLKSDSSEYQI